MGMSMRLGFGYESTSVFRYIVSDITDVRKLAKEYKKRHGVKPDITKPNDEQTFADLYYKNRQELGSPVFGGEDKKKEWEEKLKRAKKGADDSKGLASLISQSNKIYIFHRIDGEPPEIDILDGRYIDIRNGPVSTAPKKFYIESESESEACSCFHSKFRNINTGSLSYTLEIYNLDLELLVDDTFQNWDCTP